MPEIRSVARPLSEVERRFLIADLRRSQGRLRSFPKRQWSASVIIFGLLWASTVIAMKGNWLLATALWLVLGVAISALVYFSEKPQYRAAVRRCEDALRRNEAHEVSIQSEALVELEEIEDEGACYAFQLRDHRIVFVSGQDYHPSARFPNFDFSVIRIFDQKNLLVQEFIEKRGTKLSPKRKISAETKSKLKVPEHLQFIEGDLDELENLLAHRNQAHK
jgi:hypothetical protein